MGILIENIRLYFLPLRHIFGFLLKKDRPVKFDLPEMLPLERPRFENIPLSYGKFFNTNLDTLILVQSAIPLNTKVISMNM